MNTIDRRSVLTGILCGVAAATAGLTVVSNSAKSLPLGAVKDVAKPERLAEEAGVTVHVHPRRHHRNRRWRCRWHRGRKVCGWR
jgi:hypothetical protein